MRIAATGAGGVGGYFGGRLAQAGESVVFVARGAHRDALRKDGLRVESVAGDFTVFRTVEHLTVPLGGDVNRELEISVGEGFAPAPRDEAFAQRLRDQREQNR